MDSEPAERDQHTLRCIFDPTGTMGKAVGDTYIKTNDYTEEDEENNPNWQESRRLCVKGVALADTGKLQEALVILNSAVEAAIDRAAGYNDRAQVLRLMNRDDEALLDLNKALDLTVGKKTRARAMALCQLGSLLRKDGKDEADQMFDEAAEFGCPFAKLQVVEKNPYAALCNQFMKQVNEMGN